MKIFNNVIGGNNSNDIVKISLNPIIEKIGQLSPENSSIDLTENEVCEMFGVSSITKINTPSTIPIISMLQFDSETNTQYGLNVLANQIQTVNVLIEETQEWQYRIYFFVYFMIPGMPLKLTIVDPLFGPAVKCFMIERNQNA